MKHQNQIKHPFMRVIGLCFRTGKKTGKLSRNFTDRHATWVFKRWDDYWVIQVLRNKARTNLPSSARTFSLPHHEQKLPWSQSAQSLVVAPTGTRFSMFTHHCPWWYTLFLFSSFFMLVQSLTFLKIRVKTVLVVCPMGLMGTRIAMNMPKPKL